MKIRVISDEFKALAKNISSLVKSSAIKKSGIIGLTFLDGSVRIRAFDGMWAFGEVECATIGDFDGDVFCPIRHSSLSVIMLHVSGESTVLDVSKDRIIAGSATVRTVSDTEWSEEDISPEADLDHASWHILPPQAKTVARSLTDNDGGKTSCLYIGNDVIFAYSDRFKTGSVFIPDWDLPKDFIPVPYAVATGALGLDEDEEVLLATVGDLIAFSVGAITVVSPRSGAGMSKMYGGDALTTGWSPETSAGAVSSSILTELRTSSMQGSPHIVLWVDDDRPNKLFFFSQGSEVGNSGGSMWSDVKGSFSAKVNPSFIERVLAPLEMWRLQHVRIPASEKYIPIISIVSEDGTRHFVWEIRLGDGELERAKEKTYSLESEE